MVPSFFHPAAPPGSVPGHGLGNRAAKLRHRTVFVFVLVSFSSCRPTPFVAGVVLGDFAAPTVAQDYVIFLLFGGIISPRPPSLRWWRYFGFSFFHRHVFAPPPSFPGDMAMVFIDVFFSVMDRPPCFPFLLGVPCRLRSLAVQRCGSGFEKPHLRHMF